MKLSFKAVAAAAILAVPTIARAQSYDVYVGYVDGLRGSVFFPSIWFGDAAVQFFSGYSGSAPDAGAIMFYNSGSSTMHIQSLVYNLDSYVYDFGYALGGGGVALDPGKYAIFTGLNNSGDFDTSDFAVGPCGSPNPHDPHLAVSVDGAPAGYDDTGHRLDTGGVDLAGCPSGTNESYGWAKIGTTSDRHDVFTPEPSTIVLTASGLGMVGGIVRRRRRSA